MPKNKNTSVSKSPFREYRDRGGQSQESNSNNPEDLRSKEEKVSDLTDLFIGDYHIDTDIIHAVLEECNWNVEDATEKLFEVFFTNNKPVQSKKKESNDLASIAVSILMDKCSTIDKNSDSDREASVPTGIVDLNLASIAGHINNNSSPINQKRSNNLRPKISSKENLVHYDYDEYCKSIDSKHSTDSKTLFESKSSQRDFYNKNSFGDMVVNMEHYKENDDSVTKPLKFNVLKDDLTAENNNSQRSPAAPRKIKPKFDLSKVSVDAAPSMNKINNNSFDEKKNTSLFYTDKSMDSLFCANNSPSTSTEWNIFYQQLNLQPVQTEKVYPEICVNELLASPKDSDPPDSVPLLNKIKPSSESEESNESATNFASFESKLDNRISLQSSKLGSEDQFKKSLSTDNDVIENNLVSDKLMNTVDAVEKPSQSKIILSVEAPEFVPRVFDVKQPMPRKSPGKQSKYPTKTPSSNDNRLVSSEKASSFKKGKDMAYKKQPTISRSDIKFTGPQTQIIDPMDPLGWKEIKSMTSPKAHKSDFKFKTKLLPHNRDYDHVLVDPQSKYVSSKGHDKNSDDKTAAVPPFTFNTPTIPPNKNKKTIGKKKDKFSKSSDLDHSVSVTSLNLEGLNMGPSRAEFEANKLSIQNVSHIEENAVNSFSPSSFHVPSSLSLPPSLQRKPNLDNVSNPPLPQREKKSKTNSVNCMVPKAELSTKGVSVANRVQFVGVKTPVGKLKHYIDKKQPVMFILRGLPGSGKSFLAAQLVSECQRFNLEATVLSSDSYFTSAGQYNFNFEQLSEAHIWNRQRAKQCLKNKQPVIIIDNTNTTMWEMMPYAEMAIINSYDIQVCEPDTQWKNKVQELARRNQHGVTKDHIKRMKDRYEHVTTEDVLRAVTKSLKGKHKLPSNCNTTIDQPVKAPMPDVPAFTHVQSRQLKSNSGNLSTSSPNPDAICDTMAKEVASTSVQGLTQWIPAMEQRDPIKRPKRTGRVEKQPKPHEITLDFLNNSIKKAMIGIEKTQEEKDEGPQKENETFKQDLNIDIKESFDNLSKVLHFMEEKKKVSPSSEIKTEPSVDHGEEKKLNSKELDNKEEHETAVEARESVNSTEFPLVASNLTLSYSKHLDQSGSTGDLYYSCGSEEEADDSKEKNHLNSCDEKNEDEVKSRPACIKSFDENVASDLIVENKNCQDECKETLDSGVKKVNCVEEASVVFDSSVENLDYFNRENTVDEKECNTSIVVSSVVENDGELLYISSSSDLGRSIEESDNTSCPEKMNETSTIVSSRGVVSQKHPLVLYSDSEDDENDNESHQDVVSKIKTLNIASPVEKILCDKINDEHLETSSQHFGDTLECKDQGEANTHVNSLHEVESDIISCVESEGKGIENDKGLTVTELHSNGECLPNQTEDGIDITASQIKEESPESNSSTKEPSPCSNVSEEPLYIKKKKNKKIKPVENTLGPFLEDALKEKSKTEKWNKFFFSDNQNTERPPSPNKKNHKVVITDAGSQCEPYYFTMVYRLNSQTFSDQQPIDLSDLDVAVVKATIDLSWEDRFCSDVIVQRKSETTDRSTITDETLDSEEVDLDTLQNCFPEYSRKQLEDVMAVCHNNLEWVTNNLMDAPPVIDYTEEEKEEEENEGTDQLELENRDGQSAGQGAITVKTLAQLCREVVQNNEVLDSDDFEQQIIIAGQTRLQKIEKFAWVRMHSSSVDSSQAPVARETDLLFGNFNLDSFSGGYGLDDFETDPVKPFKTKSLSPRVPLHDDLAAHGSENRKGQSVPDQKSWFATPSAPTLPAEFIKCLETNYGSFNTDFDESGLVLDDTTARKIHNCLKLLISKKRVQVGSSHEKQMRDDEAMARALQEAENAGRHELPSHNPSIQGWTNQMPSWMSSDSPPHPSISIREKKRNSHSNPARLNSVSETLHSLRGVWPKRLKPYKFHSQLQRKQDFSVWTSKPSSGLKVADMHSIMEEEKAREAKFRKMLVMNKSSGDVDALATKIKRTKLSRMCPFLPPDVLEEIFMNNNYSLEMTVECLKSQYDHIPVHVSSEQEEEEINKILRKTEKDSSVDETYQYQYEDVDDVSYEDLRKEAHFYDKLANECRQKAHRHHREGMHNVAFFYRQEVKKYLAEKEEANQRAARLLFNKGSERLLRENTLDLHSYHINEAIEAVNLALEIKKEEYKSQIDRKRGHLTIITGRGRNSRWGIPKLKPAIIGHLNNKNFRFEEMAPGMFKVYLTQESQ